MSRWSDGLTPFQSRVYTLFDRLPKQRQAGLRYIPVRRLDLMQGEPNKAVASLQRVVEERKLMLACQSRQP